MYAEAFGAEVDVNVAEVARGQTRHSLLVLAGVESGSKALKPGETFAALKTRVHNGALAWKMESPAVVAEIFEKVSGTPKAPSVPTAAAAESSTPPEEAEEDEEPAATAAADESDSD